MLLFWHDCANYVLCRAFQTFSVQICKQVVTRLLSSRYKNVFALLVRNCCDKSGTSCSHVVTRLVTVTDLLQDVRRRLIQAVLNKLLRACCYQLLVNNLLHANDIRLVGTICCESIGLVDNCCSRAQYSKCTC